MRIEKMTATFGTLNRQTLELKPGLNVIESGNESGKTTWCAFIRAMLYGVRTDERSRAGSTPDKKRYLPWSGAGMEGTMTVSHGGEEYELVRLTRQGLLGECEATRAGTAEPVPELSGKSPGETLIGATEDVFRRSAFISHTAMRVDNSSELEKRISELVSSGEENYSYEEAHDRIQKLKKRVRNARGGGEIPEAEREADRLSGELRAIEEASESSVRSEQERLGLISAAEKMEKYIVEKERWDKKLGMRRLSAARAMETAKAKELESARAALSDGGRDITEGRVALARDAIEAAEEYKRRAEERRAALADIPAPEEKNKNAPLFGFIAAGLGVVMAIAGAVMKNIPLLIGAAVVLAAGLAAAFTGIKKNKERAELSRAAASRHETASAEAERELNAAVERRDKLLEELGCTPEEGEELLRRVKTAEKEADAAARTAASLAYLECYDPDIESAEEPEGAPANRELLERTRERIAELGRLEARLGGERAHLGDPAVIATKLEAVNERRAELLDFEECLQTADAALEEAAREMQSRFAPIVGARAAEMLAQMTGGRYAAVSFDRGMAFKTRLEGDPVARDSAFLSEGTADQMYLAVRLAICQLVLGGEEPCPIVLDDALACFDDERAAQAMALLADIAKTRQVILFTCRARDAELAARCYEKI